MQTLAESYRGLSILVSVNWDRLFYAGMIVVALWAGAALGKIYVH